ncbi:MAG TPA: hypothetical protein VK325_04680 [Pseudoxanthomonas sp.]|nr:hypothetical protein [Pseudoxanthomonas sp.]
MLASLNRFLADNFGAGLSTHGSSNSVFGLYRTLEFVPAELSKASTAGMERCSTVIEAFHAISSRKVTPIGRLAMVNSEGIPRTESFEWGNAFRLFIGSDSLSRIGFWNCRLLGNIWFDTTNALILDPAYFNDDELVAELGQYLNKHNFLGGSGSAYQVQIHSASESIDVLAVIKEKLAAHTYNAIAVGKNANAQVVPSKQALEQRTYKSEADFEVIKFTKDDTMIVAAEPAHFIYLPPQRRAIAQGQWVVELNIDRGAVVDKKGFGH